MSLSNYIDNPLIHQDKTKTKEDPEACIFVASLNKDLTDKELQSSVKSLFKKWGKISSVKVFKDWLKRPYGFVQYQSVADSKRALKEAPGTKLNGRFIRCEPAKVNRSICIISLNQPFNKNYIQDQLSVFGEIENVSILKPQDTFHSIFVKFKYRDDAIKAYLNLKFSDNENLISLKNLSHPWCIAWAANLDMNYVNEMGPTSVRIDKSSIFVNNLNESTQQDELYQKFSKYGPILNIHIVCKPTSRKTFAFIKFKFESNVSKAIEQEDNTFYNEKLIRVCYRQYLNKTKNPNVYSNSFHYSSPSIVYVPSYYNTNSTFYDPQTMISTYPLLNKSILNQYHYTTKDPNHSTEFEHFGYYPSIAYYYPFNTELIHENQDP